MDEKIQEMPKCIALVVCNEVIEDKQTNNKSLISIFNRIMVNGLPAIQPKMYIMASLTGAKGEWNTTFEIIGPKGQVIFSADGKLGLNDPMSVIDIVIQIINLPLQENGAYTARIICEKGRLLNNRRFVVERMKT